ncbi:MAG: branched-chain amino acid ABC transporter permease [Chloroflexi bacterium]|nr:branched-chain amino acid ABC transporter permease [Chloroflexota bacterium]
MVGRHSFVTFVGIIVAAAVIGATVDDAYFLRLGIYTAIYSLVAIGLNLLFGNAGQISLGHAGFFAIGAYGAAVLMKNFGVPFLLVLPVMAIISGLVGVLIGYAALRLRGHYLAMATLAFGLIVFGLLVEVDYTGSTAGITAIPPIALLGYEIIDPRGIYLFSWAIVAVIYLITLSLLSSRVGRALIAIREDEVATSTMGIDVARYKIQVFALSAAYAGIAGAIYAAYMGIINPFSFGVLLSITLLMMIVVGGLGSVPGSVIGAAILTILPEFGREWENYRLAGYGVMLVLLIIFAPKGVAGILGRLFELGERVVPPREHKSSERRSPIADR